VAASTNDTASATQKPAGSDECRCGL
jgi:hypothetical protein